MRATDVARNVLNETMIYILKEGRLMIFEEQKKKRKSECIIYKRKREEIKGDGVFT
jgi:hypothetical protein